jgi:hypothetical protein
MTGKPRLFISAPASVKIGALRTILSELGARVSDAFDFAPGDPLNETTTRRISKADGVVVVYPDASASVAFDAGSAAALRKPTFVLLDPAAPIPAFIQSQLYLRSSLKDTDTLRASLTRFVQDLKVKRRPLSRRVRREDDSEKSGPISSFLGHLSHYRASSTPSEIERRVIAILKSSGVQVESKSSGRDDGVDCVVWSEQLSGTIGNPIIIQIKAGKLVASQLVRADERLQRYLEATGARCGILLYLDRTGKRFRDYQPRSAAILRFDIEDFARKLQSHSFEEVLLTERNRMVHGGAE